MRKFIAITLLLLLAAVPLAGQSQPDYAIQNIRPPLLTADETQVIVAFDVVNNGGDAEGTATVSLTNTDNGEILATEILDPLPAEAGVTVSLLVPVESLPETGSQIFRLTVIIDEVGDSSISFGSVMLRPADQLERETTGPANQLDSETQTNTQIEGATLDLLGFSFNTDDPLHVAALVGIGVAALIMLLLLVVILRLILRRDPKFTVEPPPYANMPTLSPSSNAGRRQGWQFHANNDLQPPYHAEEGATHIRKVLTSIDGGRLENWEIAGLRLSQYDQYGRISRSEVIARSGTLRRLNRIAAKSREPEVDVEKLQKRLDGVVKPLARRLRSNINRRSSTLPIAMDLRFEGGHGEVRIYFELYQLDHGRWQRVDAWEPEMMVRGQVIHENLTYTLRGLLPGEELKDLSQRLAVDMRLMLLSMLGHEQTPVAEDTA